MFLSFVLIANGTERGTSSKGGNTLPIRRGHGGNSKLAIRKKSEENVVRKIIGRYKKGKKSAKKATKKKHSWKFLLKKRKECIAKNGFELREQKNKREEN